MRYEMWTIAYRNNNGNIFTPNNENFKIVKNTWRYWYADPFLYKHIGKNWLFAEAYDRLKRKGVIACLNLDDKNSKWSVVLETASHLSYPYIYEEDGEIFMIPESYCANEIAVYRAVNFPFEWEKIRTLKSNIICVDTTMFAWRDKKYYVSMEFSEDKEYIDIFDNNFNTLTRNLCDNKDKRPGGKFFVYNSEVYCPMQDCSNTYGGALIINKVLDVSEKGIITETEKVILPEDIQSDIKYKPLGIHTYNFNEDYEVVDLKGYEKDVFAFPARCVNFILRRLKWR